MDYLSFEVHYYLRNSFTEVIKCEVGSKSKSYGYGSIKDHIFEITKVEKDKVTFVDLKTNNTYVLDGESVTIKDQKFFDNCSDVESLWIKVSKADAVIDSDFLIKHCIYGVQDRERVMNLNFNHFKKGINEIILEHKELQPMVTVFRRRADLAYSIIQDRRFSFPFTLTKKEVDIYKDIFFMDLVKNEVDQDFRDQYFTEANRAKLIFGTFELVKGPSGDPSTWSKEDLIRKGYVAEMMKDFEKAQEYYKAANFNERDDILKESIKRFEEEQLAKEQQVIDNQATPELVEA